MFVNQLNNALSIDTLRNKIPSAFAEDASAKVSNRYQYLPSYPLIEYMMANGFKAFDAYQSRSRTAEGRETRQTFSTVCKHRHKSRWIESRRYICEFDVYKLA